MDTTPILGPTRRQWWVICAGILTGLVASAGPLIAADPVYESSVSVLVRPVDVGEINLLTEAELVRSTETASAASAILGPSVPAERVIDAISVRPVANTSVLVITFAAGTPQEAREGADAVAAAYLDARARSAQAGIDEQASALRRTISDYRAELSKIDKRIADLDVRSPELAGLTAQATTLTAQLTALTGRVNQIATATVDPGRVIRQPTLPTQPIRPVAWLYLAVGAGCGLVTGSAAAVVRDRVSARVGAGVDVVRRVGLPLLAQLPGDSTAVRVLSPREPDGRAINRLRNEVVATLIPDDRIILVAGADPGSGSTLVAANLAAALARADNEVILVGANVPEIAADTVPLSQVFDVGDIPGLTDVLTGRTDLSAALQPAPRIPRLRVVTPGATASAAGLLQSETARTLLSTLRRRAARYVVIEAPSPAAGADAQSLAGVTDVAILVAETGRSRYTELADAARQVASMKTRLLGVVLVPRILPRAGDDEPPRPGADEPPRAGPPGPRATSDRPAAAWFGGGGPTWADEPTAAYPPVSPPNTRSAGSGPAGNQRSGPSGRGTDGQPGRGTGHPHPAPNGDAPHPQA